MVSTLLLLRRIVLVLCPGGVYASRAAAALCQRVGGASARCRARAVLEGLPADLLAEILAEIIGASADAERGHDLEHADDYQPHAGGIARTTIESNGHAITTTPAIRLITP